MLSLFEFFKPKNINIEKNISSDIKIFIDSHLDLYRYRCVDIEQYNHDYIILTPSIYNYIFKRNFKDLLINEISIGIYMPIIIYNGIKHYPIITLCNEGYIISSRTTIYKTEPINSNSLVQTIIDLCNSGFM